MITLDVNSLYSTVMKLELPVGSGVLYENINGLFNHNYMANNAGGNASYISLHWLNHMQNTFMSDGQPIYIQCQINGSEKQIGNYFLDGYVYYNGKHIGLDFHGCRFHWCDECNTVYIGSESDKQRDQERHNFLIDELDEYITIAECQYKKIMQDDQPVLNFFWNRKTICQDDIIQGIIDDKVYGLCKVDITCPDEAKKKFLDLNFPPIFNHVSVTEEMLSSPLQTYAKLHKMKFPLDAQLTLTFNATGMILATPLLQYYLKNGLKITKIYYFVEYLKETPFKGFIDKMVAMRIEATLTNNELLQMLAKMLLNSSWGRLAMNVGNRKNTVYARSNEIKKKFKNYAQKLVVYMRVVPA